MDDIVEKAAEETSKTEEELRERWSGSPELIAEDLFRVRSLETGQMQDLDLFEPYQPKLVNAYFYSDEKIINVYKGRRIGVSFIFSVCIAIDGIINPDTFYPIVSRTQTQAENRIDDIRQLLENAKVDIGVSKDNVAEIELDNGSNFMAFSGSPDSSRGDDAAKTVFVDEMAFLEDQQESMRSFMPFIALGGNSKMLQVSTPNLANDIFLQNHKRGSPRGQNGIVSVKQPTFEDPEDIDIETSLLEQDVTPVRGDLDLRAVETERAQDPKGFAQEYLCQPIAEEYRFFSTTKIDEAMGRSTDDDYVFGFDWQKPHDSTVVMGVDIGISSDDTAVSVFEHSGQLRNLRYREIVDERVLTRAGITPPDRRNPSSVAQRLAQIHNALDVDYVILDKTGAGEGFQAEIDRQIGRGAHGFNFSDKEAVKTMMGDFNYSLHNDLVTLPQDERLEDELSAIVKKKSHEYQKPKFTGKDHSESGKDDLAIATVMAAHPPNIDTGASKSMHSQDNRYSSSEGDTSPSQTGASHYTGAKKASAHSGSGRDEENALRYNRTTRKSYTARHSR